jgi:ATP-dependent helicase/DNAse subunit B
VPGSGEIESISVTRFKSYLACPYRYYLRHVQKLEAVDDAARELDGRAFGNLIHSVLGELGRAAGAPRESTQEKEVFEFLAEQLDAKARGLYGERRQRAPISLQLEQARRRLREFAVRQVQLVREDWLIKHVESSEESRKELRASFLVDGISIVLLGRIDRIDYQPTTKTLRILDYKTADMAQHPDKTHQSKGQWIDLQLPLYRHLWPDAVKDVPADCRVELGYLNLPKQAEETTFLQASWKEPDLERADEEARGVIRKLRRQEFWKPTYPAPEFSEDLAAICLDNLFSLPALLVENESDAS